MGLGMPNTCHFYFAKFPHSINDFKIKEIGKITKMYI